MCHYGLDDEKMKIVRSLDESRTLFENWMIEDGPQVLAGGTFFPVPLSSRRTPAVKSLSGVKYKVRRTIF
jgi:hypothetical protein